MKEAVKKENELNEQHGFMGRYWDLMIQSGIVWATSTVGFYGEIVNTFFGGGFMGISWGSWQLKEVFSHHFFEINNAKIHDNPSI